LLGENGATMNKQSAEEYNASKRQELSERVSKVLKTHEGKNYLERYALYMLRVQMYEISLKQDLNQLFSVSEEKADRMNLSSIFRYYVKHDIRAHPILYANIQDIARQRNSMAHELLALTGAMNELAGVETMRFFQRDLDKWVWELELAFQQYLMLKETDALYKDWGVKPTFSF
jgi:hypothetical protein